MDFTQLAAKDTAFIHFKNPKGELLYEGGKPVGVTVYGPGSKQFGIVEARQSARTLKRMQDNDNKLSMAPAEERRAEEAEDLADLTVSFDNVAYSPAGDAAGSKLFAAFYGDPALGFYTKQVSKGVSDWGNFSPAFAGS